MHNQMNSNYETTGGMHMPSMWVPNDLVDECNICKSYFNLFRRKHHCRNCGRYCLQNLHFNYSVVCAWCSDKTDYVAGYGDERVRLCDTCVRDKKVMK